MLQKFGLVVEKSCIWLISQMTSRLQHIRDEIIYNLTTKRVVCPSAIWNVGTIRKD
jgi:hypothetical protein